VELHLDERSYRGFRRLVAVFACLICAVGLLAGSEVASEAARPPLRVLQMNLCNSGIAGCYTGRSVAEAAAVIREHEPDLVTLNEICEDDVDPLTAALRDAHPGETVVSGFKAAFDRRSAADFECVTGGGRFGVGVLARIPAPYRGHTMHSGIYPTQEVEDWEERAWLCVHAVGAFYGCTTHLTYITPAVALAQCDHLLETVIPELRERGGYEPTVLGADFNLTYGGSPGLQSCLPPDHRRVDDGHVQQVVASADYRVRSRSLIDMDTTDHPSLLVLLATG
jgi:endonuclease/exonuclease/phosphatase family metal-dependent hydrolase